MLGTDLTQRKSQYLLSVAAIFPLHCLFLLRGRVLSTHLPAARAPVERARAEMEGLPSPSWELTFLGAGLPCWSLPAPSSSANLAFHSLSSHHWEWGVLLESPVLRCGGSSWRAWPGLCGWVSWEDTKEAAGFSSPSTLDAVYLLPTRSEMPFCTASFWPLQERLMVLSLCGDRLRGGCLPCCCSPAPVPGDSGSLTSHLSLLQVTSPQSMNMWTGCSLFPSVPCPCPLITGDRWIYQLGCMPCPSHPCSSSSVLPSLQTTLPPTFYSSPPWVCLHFLSQSPILVSYHPVPHLPGSGLVIASGHLTWGFPRVGWTHQAWSRAAMRGTGAASKVKSLPGPAALCGDVIICTQRLLIAWTWLPKLWPQISALGGWRLSVCGLV